MSLTETMLIASFAVRPMLFKALTFTPSSTIEAACELMLISSPEILETMFLTVWPLLCPLLIVKSWLLSCCTALMFTVPILLMLTAPTFVSTLVPLMSTLLKPTILMPALAIMLERSSTAVVVPFWFVIGD